MNFIWSVLLLILISCNGRYANAAILTGPVVYNNHRYYLLAESSWTEAEAEAMTLGGHLVTINDAAENTFVFTTFDMFGGVERFLWIGFTDDSSYGTTEGNFVWSSGEAVTYTNWNAGEPNNDPGNPEGEENFTFIYPRIQPQPDGSWNDANRGWIPALATGLCDDPCEINGVVEVVPEPSVLTMIVLGTVSLLAHNFRARRRSV